MKLYFSDTSEKKQKILITTAYQCFVPKLYTLHLINLKNLEYGILKETLEKKNHHFGIRDLN